MGKISEIEGRARRGGLVQENQGGAHAAGASAAAPCVFDDRLLRPSGRSGRGDRLEKQASAVLSRMEGAGRVEVTIMTRKAQTGGTGLMKGETGGEVPCGAMAVAQGADDPLVRMQLEQALCALLGLPNSAVSVVTGGK